MFRVQGRGLECCDSLPGVSCSLRVLQDLAGFVCEQGKGRLWVCAAWCYCITINLVFLVPCFGRDAGVKEM